jgi:O-antigen chain-terminating methyltransferase
MIAYCRTRQLPVIQSDAITYLEQLEDLSLDGIFLDQVVEHLEPEYLIRMLALCHRKLKSGGFLVAETVNPLSFASFVNFYIDLTHKRPVHPLTLQFLAESAGFKENEVRFYSEIPDEVKLQKIPVPEKIAESKRNSLLIYNNNVELLNNLMWGPRDYAIIGKK